MSALPDDTPPTTEVLIPEPHDRPDATDVVHVLNRVLAAIEALKPDSTEQARREWRELVSIFLSAAALGVAGASLALALYLSTKVQPVSLMLQGPAGP